MNIAVTALASSTAYFFATLAQGLRLFTDRRTARCWVLTISGAALVLHALLLYQTIDTLQGQNLSVWNVLSLLAWLSGTLLWLVSFFRPVDNLLIIIFPLAIVLLSLACILPGHNIVLTRATSGTLMHILLSVFTLSILCVAAMQAGVLAWQDKVLRYKRQLPAWQRFLPPIETMENLLFRFIFLGFCLLTVVLATSIWLFYDKLSSDLLEKSVLAVWAWLVFAVLLFGRHYRGWRGVVAIRYTIVGVLVLLACSLSLTIPW